MEKIEFAKETKEIQKKLNEIELNDSCEEIILKSFILSIAKYNDLIKGMTNPPKKEDYEKSHVLFLEDANWPEKFFKMI